MKFHRFATTLFATTALAASPALAANFTITNGQTVGAQSIGAGANETGTVDAGGTVTRDTGSNGAIRSDSTGGTIINNGTVSGSGFETHGVRLQSDTNTLINNSNISTGGTISFGVYSLGSDNNITNNGTITTGGSSAHGIASLGTNTTVTNSGSITTNGSSSFGLRSLGNGTTMINSGSITTNGNSALAIYSSANNNVITNNGAITTNGSQGYAMHLESGSGSNYTNNGTITTNGSQGYGIVLFGGNNSATNNGTITTVGSSGIGMFSDDPGNTLTNNGNITTSGITAYGMLSGDTGAIINNGRITTNGTNAFAMRSTGNDVTITNAGYVRSDGADTVIMTGTDSTLILKANSTIDGTVVFGGGGDRILTYDTGNTGRGGSITRITGTITGGTTTSITNTPTGMVAVQSDNTVAVISPDQFGGSNQLISQTVTDTGNVVNNRQQMALLGDTTELNSGSQYAASSDTASDSSNPNDWAIRDRKVAWAEGFGSYQERGQTSDTSDSTAISGGVLAGVDLPQTDDGIRAGYYVGGFAGNLEVGNFREIDSTGALAGGYVGKNYGEYYLSAGLDLGLSSNDSERNTGIDIAAADYNSYFTSPSLTVMRPIDGEGVTYVPNATIRYTAQFDDSYTETGSAVNQSADSRVGHSLDARAMLDARFDAKQFENGGSLKPTLRAGLQAQTQLGDNETDITILGSGLSFDPNGDDNNIDAVFGLNLSYAECERLDLYFDAEANAGLNNGGTSENYGAITRAGVKWKF